MAHLHHTARHADLAPATKGRLIRWARHYDLAVSVLTLGQRARLRRATIEQAGVRPGERVLEVGCGTGDVAIAAGKRVGAGGAVYGIDPAPEMVAVAREKAVAAGVAAEFQIGVIEALAFPDASFDLVLSSLMMHHLPHDLKRSGMAEIARVLKPGGRLLIVDAKRPTSRWARTLSDLMLHSTLDEGIQDLPALLREAGFSQVQAGDLRFGVLGYVLAHVAS